MVRKSDGTRFEMTARHVCRAEEKKVVLSDVDTDLCIREYSGTARGLVVAKSFDKKTEKAYNKGFPRLQRKDVGASSEGKYVADVTYSNREMIKKGNTCAGHPKEVVDTVSKFLNVCVYDWVQNGMTIYVRPGSSGSPVVNAKGELIGVVSTWSSEPGDLEGHEKVGLAGIVKLEHIRKFLREK